MSSPSAVLPPPALRPLHGVIDEMAAIIGPLPVRALPPLEAVGAVLAEDWVAPRSLPPQPVALIRGYAVAASDLVGVSPYAPLMLGERPPFVEAGDILPEGADAVLPGDAVAGERLVEISASPAPGENVRRAGEDAMAAQCIRRRGEPFRSIDAAIGLAGGFGNASVRHLRVGVEDPGPLGPALAALRLPPGLEITAGSTGDLRLSFGADAGEGAVRVAGGLALRGGETVAVTAPGGSLRVALPPRLDAFLAVLYALLDPLAERLTERAPAPPAEGCLTRKVVSAVGLAEIVLLRRSGAGLLQPLAVGAPGLAAWAQAQAYALLPPESEGAPEGALIEARPL